MADELVERLVRELAALRARVAALERQEGLTSPVGTSQIADGAVTAAKIAGGPGSGVHADLLDNQHVSDLDSRYVNASGDTMTGMLTVPGLEQPAGSYIFGYGDSLDPYLRANDMVFDVLQGRPPATAERWNGSAWETIDASAFRTLFRGGGFTGVYTMANGSGAIRLTWNNVPNTRFQKLAIFATYNNNALSVKCEISANGTEWTEKFTTPSYSAGSGWLMRHGYFYNSGQTPYLRLTLTPTWNNTNPIYLSCIRFFCINPYGADYALHPFTWDVDRVVTFAQTPKVGTNTVWHSGNVGPGSGLDADTVDGLEASALRGVGAIVKRTTNQTIPDSTTTVVSFDTELVDIGDCFNPNQPDRITVPTGGVYYIWGQVRWVANTNGVRDINIRIGGTDYVMTSRTAAYPNPAFLHISGIWYLQSGQIVQMTAYQTSGGNLNIEPVNGQYISLGVFRLY